MKEKTEKIFTGVPGSYTELVNMHEPRPIRSAKEFDVAVGIVQQMAGHALSRDQEDYLDVLTTLIEVYDQEHHALKIKKMSPTQALKFLIKENGMNASDLGRIIGNRALGSKILRGERELSKPAILALAKRFAVSPAIFLSAAPPLHQTVRRAYRKAS